VNIMDKQLPNLDISRTHQTEVAKVVEALYGKISPFLSLYSFEPETRACTLHYELEITATLEPALCILRRNRVDMSEEHSINISFGIISALA
jgi:hypothetical protein